MAETETGTAGEPVDSSALVAVLEELSSVFARLPTSLKMSFSSLATLGTLRRRGPVRLTELVASENVTQPAMTQLVTRLQDRGLVERLRDPTDGRAILVGLTDEGKRVISQRAAEKSAQLIRRVDALSPDDQRAISAALPALTRFLGRNPTRKSS
jgi:DNA-binding MarR family transcriptional regulator